MRWVRAVLTKAQRRRANRRSFRRPNLIGVMVCVDGVIQGIGWVAPDRPMGLVPSAVLGRCHQ